MSVCIFIWICKGGEMKLHIPLKLMGFVYLALLGCATKLTCYLVFSEEGWN